MRVRIRDQREFFAGLFFLIVGIGWGCASLLYPIGQATNMGSGYFPLTVSIILAFLGMVSIFRGLRSDDLMLLAHWDIAPLLFIFAGIGFFAFFIDRIGLIPATLGMVVISSYRQIWLRPLEVIMLACITAIFVALLFVYLLKLNIDLF